MNDWKMWTCVAAIAVFGTASFAVAEEATEKGNKHQSVALEKVPKDAREGLTKAAKGAKLENVRSEVEGGKTYYEADVTVGGKPSEVRVDADGKNAPDDDDGDEGR